VTICHALSACAAGCGVGSGRVRRPEEPSRQVSPSGRVRGGEAGRMHKRAGLFGPGEVPGLVMPEGYKRSVAAWLARLNGHAVP
jgi:hypothetical protein